MKKCKVVLLISVIGFILSIVLGNIFNAISFGVGKYIAMAVLYISIGTGILSLIGYLVTKKNDNEKMPTWIVVLIGIIIAIVCANGISQVIEYNQKQRDNYNIKQNSVTNQENIDEITKMAITCATDVTKNKLVSFLGEEISEIRYAKQSNENIILLSVKSGTKQTVYAYTGVMYLGTDGLADVDESNYKTTTEKEMIKLAKEIRQFWNNSIALDTNKILNSISK